MKKLIFILLKQYAKSLITLTLKINHKNLIKFVEDRPGHDFRYS